MASQDPGSETPLAPLPEAGTDTPAATARKPGRRSATRAAKRGAPAAASPDAHAQGPLCRGLHYARRSWRVLLGLLLIHLALGFAVVMPLHMRLAARLDGHMHAPAMAGAPDAVDAGSAGFWTTPGVAESTWRDVRRLEEGVFETQAVALFWVVLVAWLLGALVAGGHLGVAHRARGSTTDPGHPRARLPGFLESGARHYGAMLRVGLVFALLLLLAARIILEMWGASVAPTQSASADSGVAWWGEQTRWSVLTLIFLWLRVVADLARADLVIRGGGSAWGATLRGFAWTMRHPLASFGLALGVGVPFFLLILGIAWLAGLMGTGTTMGVVVAFLLVQLAVLMRLASRAALLAGDVALVERWRGD